MKSPTSSIAKRWRRIAQSSEHVLRLSGYYNCLNQVGVNLPDKIVIDKNSLVTITKLLELRDEL